MTKEIIHHYKGFGRVPSHCVVRIFSDDGEHFICFMDINEGTSVTNASEQLATEIVDKCRLNPGDCRFFETYKQYDFESIDEIEYDWKSQMQPFEPNKWVAKNPKWKPSDPEIREMFKLNN